MAARLNTPPEAEKTSSETVATHPEVPRFILYSPVSAMPLASVVAPASPVPAKTPVPALYPVYSAAFSVTRPASS